MGKQYEQIYRFENLYQAWRLAKRKKSRTPRWRFLTDLGTGSWSLHDRLKARAMRAAITTLRSPSRRSGEIYASTLRTEWCKDSICDNCCPWMESGGDLRLRRLPDRERNPLLPWTGLSGFLRSSTEGTVRAATSWKCDIRKYLTISITRY